MTRRRRPEPFTLPRLLAASDILRRLHAAAQAENLVVTRVQSWPRKDGSTTARLVWRNAGAGHDASMVHIVRGIRL